MSIFSYHLVELRFLMAVKGIISNPITKNTKGLIHSEYMTAMTLGSPILSTSRFLIRQVAIFAQWESETALDEYLENNKFGRILAKGWHVRLSFMRKWGKFSAFKIPTQTENIEKISSPVVAVTIARMKPFEIPRFIHWGRPVEKLVRDHPGTTLSLASFKFPNTVSTFSIWKTEKEMTDMVQGHSAIPKPKRHSDAMKERERKNFHFEFTTLRFEPIAEFGTWKGQKNFTSSF
jgi:hypothetical protein